MDKNEIIFLNYLKAIAIILVIIHHYSFSKIQFTNPIFYYIVYMAVPIFMVVSGYVYTKSCIRRNLVKFFDLYNIKLILKRILRLTLPFTLIFILEYIFNVNGLQEKGNLLIEFYHGGVGVGKGSYYYTIMLQFIFLFPILYYLIKKINKNGYLLLFIVEFIYNYLCYLKGISLSTYRLQIYKYITLIGSGIWLALNPQYEIKRKYLYVSFIVGVLFIYIIGCKNYPVIPYNFDYWKYSSGIFITLYIFPILYFLLRKYSNAEVYNPIQYLFNTIGKSSWHIYLVQMLYYITLDTQIHNLNILVHLTINLLFSVFLGILFYKLETLLKCVIFNKKNTRKNDCRVKF